MNKMNRNTNISKTMHCIVIMLTMILLGQDIYFFLLRNEESNLKVNLNYMIRTLFFHTDVTYTTSQQHISQTFIIICKQLMLFFNINTNVFILFIQFLGSVFMWYLKSGPSNFRTLSHDLNTRIVCCSLQRTTTLTG